VNKEEFDRLPWRVLPNGNREKEIEGKKLLILRSMLCAPEYNISWDGQLICHYQGNRIHTVEEAEQAAFALLST